MRGYAADEQAIGFIIESQTRSGERGRKVAVRHSVEISTTGWHIHQNEAVRHCDLTADRMNESDQATGQRLSPAKSMSIQYDMAEYVAARIVIP